MDWGSSDKKHRHESKFNLDANLDVHTEEQNTPVFCDYYGYRAPHTGVKPSAAYSEISTATSDGLN